jgi:hypothetical protein
MLRQAQGEDFFLHHRALTRLTRDTWVIQRNEYVPRPISSSVPRFGARMQSFPIPEI